MRKLFKSERTGRMAGIVCMLCMTAGTLSLNAVPVRADELTEEYWESSEADALGEETADSGESLDTSAPLTGTYSIVSGWTVDNAATTQETTVYKQEAHQGETNTSTISCSYLDTNYSVFEYEQLRDMLTNNLVYSNVNAQISTSAVYTDAKDYLYIVIVDDTAQEYRNIYCYVVGDYRCFCVSVQEYRAEAEALKVQELTTPQEAGQSIAEKFVWN